MATNRTLADKVRPSRDGHEFHESWAARRALQLLLPKDNLVGIAIEGLSPTDQTKAISETVEIADIVLYYGKKPSFKGADTVSIVQFKYSVSSSDKDFRCSHAKLTIEKFSAAYIDHNNTYGSGEVSKKLLFELVTNRPIYPAFVEAIECIASRRPMSAEAKKQAEQFKAACGLKGTKLYEFASKFHVCGVAGSLEQNKRALSKTLVNWSGAADAMARARLGGMKQLLRNKAGTHGEKNNVITLTDVLDALEVQDEDDLFPCPASFPVVGEVVKRKQLEEVIALVLELDRPLLIHAAGGVGKTVFLESLAKVLSEGHEVILFDCFGGGAYRSKEDSRHLPQRGLVHIANSLACNGLCDPLLPGSVSVEELVKAFRRRLEQSVDVLRKTSPDMNVVLIIDAIDNAAEHAADCNEISFPKLLMESFQYGGKISGVRLVVACRTHRREISRGDVDCAEFQLEPFTIAETELYLRNHISKISQTEIQVAQARSGGNARILEHLVSSDRGLLGKSESDNPIALDDLLTQRINSALKEAIERGYKKADTDAFLAGLSVLPPPVPLDEYASAHGMNISAVESFAADFAPLLERTKYGLMFRDEPTETLIRQKYASDVKALRLVAKNLLGRQDSSFYAARTLPGLLQKLNDGDKLFKLAFDERFPESITSMVGKRNIRYARLKAAVLHAAKISDKNKLVQLLVELSSIAAVDQRGAEYILEHPDLVVTAQDVDAMRRLFEMRTAWQGTRHARLAIANTLSGDFDNAYRHAVRANEWITNYTNKLHERGVNHDGPDRLDVASIPVCLVAQGRVIDASNVMRRWKDWYAFEVAEHIFALIEQAKPVMSKPDVTFKEYIDGMTNGVGMITAALSFVEIGRPQCLSLIKRLSKACTKQSIEIPENNYRQRRYDLQSGLLKATAIAASIGLRAEAKAISKAMSFPRPGIWVFGQHYHDDKLFQYLTQIALASAVTGKEIQERNINPKELFSLSSSIRSSVIGPEYKKELLKKVEKEFRSKKVGVDGKRISLSYEQKNEMERYINEKQDLILSITRAYSKVLGSRVTKGDKAFKEFLVVWGKTSKTRDRYGLVNRNDNFLQQRLCSEMALFAVWARTDLKYASIKMFLDILHEQDVLGPSTIIEVVAILARRPHLHVLAGEQAYKAKALIEKENEVSNKAGLYAQLARAILPASRDETIAYFKIGLEQMDAIGSGDYRFTNELLLFASSIKGEELVAKDFHTLTNICELNMSDEAEKFPWFAFAKGLSRTSGCKGLAKICRWDDRSKISLDYTLLPYLTALIEDSKIAPEDALALLRLSNPVELHSCDTASFAQAVYKNNYKNHAVLIGELIQQFEDNNPGVSMASTVKTLASVAEKSLGKRSDTTKYLHAAHKHFAIVNNEHNENMNYRGKIDPRLSRRTAKSNVNNREKLKKIAATTTPCDETSMTGAVDEINELNYIHEIKGEFFEKMRSKLSYADRGLYIEVIAKLENLDIYTKLTELGVCKEKWGKSVVGIATSYRSIGILIIQRHVDDFLSFDSLSGYLLDKVSILSGVPISVLAQELITRFASLEVNVSASVWLGLASHICEETDGTDGRIALTRLLNSSSANLASNVTDGKWEHGLYPSSNPVEIVAGLVWCMLGSPHAVDRWRAAHSVRCLVKLERWNVIDALVKKIGSTQAHPFQAPELSFYYMHARLWLLIALARIALDNPGKIAKYSKMLKEIALNQKSPHVLMRHFAAQAIQACVKNGNIRLSAKEFNQIRDIDLSPFPKLKEKIKEGRHGHSSWERPKGAPKLMNEFHFDYDFQKYDISYLSDVFGKPTWEVKDIMTKVVHEADGHVDSMYDLGGREGSRSYRRRGVDSGYHTYGQQLGWHALYLTAGRLLSSAPVTEDSYEEEPWDHWLNGELLARQDGLWLSDGMDRQPLETKVNLLVKGQDRLSITGDKATLIKLINLENISKNGLVVDGEWKSTDNIQVHIMSALVAKGKGRSFIKSLIKKDPFNVWLPTLDEYGNDRRDSRDKNANIVPWVVHHSSSEGLDSEDPLAAANALRRPYFSKDITTEFRLKKLDPFGRSWGNSAKKQMAHSEAWGYDSRNEEDASGSGLRLMCSVGLLKDVLAEKNKDLLVLIKLQRYEKGYGDVKSTFTNTIAIVKISDTLHHEFYLGAVNHALKSEF